MNSFLGCLAVGDAPLVPGLFPSHPDTLATPRSALYGPSVWRNGSLTIVVEGALRIADDGAAGAHLAPRIAELYLREGQRMLGKLRGPFALAIVNEEARAALLAIDRMGVHRLCWALDGGTLAFGSHAGEVAALRPAPPALNRQALFDFVLEHVIAAPATVYVGVSKLLAGSFVEIRSGRAQTATYWNPDFSHVSSAAADALQREVLPTLDRAVARCAPDDRTGTFLSGGLDSSTVTGVLTRSRTRPTHAFSVGFGVDEFNELSYARIATAKFGCAHHVYEVVPNDIVELVPRIAAAYDEPFGNSSAVPTLCCARLAREHGMDHLLAGDGGDEVFGGNARYVRQSVFEHYGRLPSWLRAGLLEPLASRIDPETAPLPFRKFSSYVRQARVPLPERFESWNLVYREGPARVFDPEFLRSVEPDHPLKQMRECWERCASTDLLDRMLWYDWKLTLADNDLRKVSRMCELAGIKVSYPMLDEEVVDLSIKVPSAAKIAGGELRTFFKRSVSDFLPAEIINKEKHGFGLPFGQWLKTHVPLQELVYATLDSLRTRGILHREFIERVANEHRSGHPGYYGYAIWDMVMLEQWLQQSRAGV
jgi:asparagine synthase (glutamine-hydrolysing)